MFNFIYGLFLVVPCFSLVQCNICNFTVWIHRDLQLNGFHRAISYDITLNVNQLDLKPGEVNYYEGCILVVQQPLPAGIYVDPDELESLRRMDKLSAFPDNAVDIEVAAPFARPFNVYIFNDVQSGAMKIDLPVHVRYQKPSRGGGYVTNKVDSPSVFIRCPDKRLKDCSLPITTKTHLCDQHPDKCVWRELPVNFNSSLLWKVPVGNLDHACYVDMMTMATVVMSSVYIMYRVHAHTPTFSNRRPW